MFDWDEKPELNITPLVDVMLVLLAILMVISPNIVYEELIRLPKGSAQKELSKLPPVNITITKEGEIKVNKETFKTDSFADNFYRYAQTLDTEATVMISADESLGYGEVMSVLSTVKRAGFREVSLATAG
ncbi:MAG: biopolymer transporter ExbD [Sulfuricurvum sp. MLSB]|uniref:ExbD/TolR family protein n=1 Tax=unclassified Sulfuricurvum TaxID=2632390 RepID=UPI000502D724|nr:MULTISPECIES: biopolymer transporter ExbD [unclassified Sulfuricurvum]KFN40129.1 MAG: biopolymer transporter ExbD [Sulfuricurvum sp. MLSB]